MEVKKKGAKFLVSFSVTTTPVRAHEFFHRLKQAVFSFLFRLGAAQRPASCWECMLFPLFYILSHSSHRIYIFLFLFTLKRLQFEHASVFNTCDLGCYLGAQSSCFMCLLTPHFSSLTMCGSFYLENLHKLGLNIVFCLFQSKKPNA